MGLISVGILEDKGANLSLDANIRTINYQFIFDARILSTDEVLADGNMPRIGDECVYNSTLRLKNISLSSKDNRIWIAACEYTADASNILEGYAYGFKCSPILKEEVVTRAYSHEIIQGETIISSKGLDAEAMGEPEPNLPIVVSTGNPMSEPLMGVYVNKQFSWWQLEPEAMNEYIESGEIYDQIGFVNSQEVVIGGRTVKKFEGEMKSITPERYFYTNPVSLESELRYKTSYVVEVYQKGTAAITLDQDYQAKLAPLYEDAGAESESEVLRNVRLADLPDNAGKIVLNDANDKEVQDPVKLNGTGVVLDVDESPVYNKFGYKKTSDWTTTMNLAIANGDSLNASTV